MTPTPHHHTSTKTPHSYEQVTGRLTWARAAGYQAVGGGILGALFGWVLGLFDLVNPLI